MIKRNDILVVYVINTINKDAMVSSIKERLVVKELTTIIINFMDDDIDGYDERVCELSSLGSYTFTQNKFDINLNNRVTPLPRPFFEKPHILELKALPSYLHYAFFGDKNTLLIIIVANLVVRQVEAQVSILNRFKRAIGHKKSNLTQSVCLVLRINGG